MSQAIPPLQYESINEPRMEVSNIRKWLIEKGAQTVTPQVIASQAYSTSSISFSIIPPSESVVLDRRILLQVPVHVVVTGTGPDSLLQTGRFAPRSHALSKVISTMALSINSFSTSIQLQQCIGLLEHYKSDVVFRDTYGSIFPQMLDSYQNYSAGDGAVNNPLAPYFDNSAQPARGAYPMILSNNQATSATFDMVLQDYVYLPPCIHDGHEAGGLTHLNNLQLLLTLQNLAYAFSASTAATNAITSMAITIPSAPSVLVTWLTPRLDQHIPREITYPYFQIQPFITQTSGSLASLATVTQQTNVLQFSSVPYRIMLAVRRSQTDVFASQTSMLQSTDTYAAIKQISINFNNVSGMLSQSNAVQLYEMSMDNGLSDSWVDFSGQVTSPGFVPTGAIGAIGTVGSVLSIDPSKDLGLDSSLANGSLGAFQFSAQITYQNVNETTAYPFEIVVLAVYEGILDLALNIANSQIGITSKEDVLTCPKSDLTYHAIKNIYGSGSIFDDIGRGLKKAADFVVDNKLISKGLGLIPSPYTQIASKAADIVGLGAEGGVLVGGKRLDKKAMRKRLMY